MAITLKFEEYRNKINRDIDENEKAIDELKERSKKMEKKQQADYDKSIQSLEDQNKLLKEKANAYKRTAGQNWDVFQREFNDDLAKFGKALKDFTIRNEKK
jgi:DNA-binding transcriptional regulator GbsR (MarR family)